MRLQCAGVFQAFCVFNGSQPCASTRRQPISESSLPRRFNALSSAYRLQYSRARSSPPVRGCLSSRSARNRPSLQLVSLWKTHQFRRQSNPIEHTFPDSMPAKLLSCGAPGVTRTPDLLVRSQTLYPTELRAQGEGKLHAQFNMLTRLLTNKPCRLCGTAGLIPAAQVGRPAHASGAGRHAVPGRHRSIGELAVAGRGEGRKLLRQMRLPAAWA